MAYECKYGKLKTPSKKGRTVRICRRKKRTKKCAKKVCKYGKLKVSRRGRCCKRKPKTSQIPESIHNSINKYISLFKKNEAGLKKAQSLSDSSSTQTDRLKIAEIRYNLAVLTARNKKVLENVAKLRNSINEKLQNFINKAKNDADKTLRQALVDKAEADMAAKLK